MKVEDARKYEHALARAFMVDLESLLREYEEKKSFTFDSFAEVWKEKDFSLIYGWVLSYLLVFEEFVNEKVSV